MTVTVACVLRESETYTSLWVDTLAKAVDRHMGYHQFVCITDVPEKVRSSRVEAVTMMNRWPGWWSKIELFREGLFDGPVLYFDLDVVITGQLDGLVRHDPGMTMCRDFVLHGWCNSSVMAWNGDYSHLYDLFATNPEKVMSDYTRRRDRRIGDQAFIEDYAPVKDIFPDGEVVSYRKQAREGVPDGAKIVAFHGRPKQHEAGGWVKWP